MSEMERDRQLHLAAEGLDALDSDVEGLLIAELAEYPERALLDEQRLAQVFKVSTRTIRRMVTRAELPPPLQLGNRSVWIAGRILDYLDKAAERREAEARREAERLKKLAP